MISGRDAISRQQLRQRSIVNWHGRRRASTKVNFHCHIQEERKGEQRKIVSNYVELVLLEEKRSNSTLWICSEGITWNRTWETGLRIMSVQLSRVLGVGLRRGILVSRNQKSRWLCSSTGRDDSGKPVKESADGKTESQSKTSDISSPSNTGPSEEILEVMRNFKPPNADEYAVEPNERSTDVARDGVEFSQSVAYRLSVQEALGVTKSQQAQTRRALRMRYLIHSTVITLAFYLFFILPGEEEFDEITGEVYREPPGWVDMYNEYLLLRSILRGEERPKPYVWIPN